MDSASCSFQIRLYKRVNFSNVTMIDIRFTTVVSKIRAKEPEIECFKIEQFVLISILFAQLIYFSTGKFSLVQAANPPCNVRTSEKSFFLNMPAALGLRLPMRQTTTTVRDLNFFRLLISD